MAISYQPLPQRVLKAHNQTSKNYQWLQDNWDELSQKYANRFVAITNSNVVFSAETHLELLEYLSENRNLTDLIGVHIRPNDRILLR